MAKQQTMKPETAAKKLGIFLPGMPEELQGRPISRDELNELQVDPPPWLRDLRRDGPHPRSEVAHRLGISNSGLGRSGASDSMTTAQIRELLDDMPQWLSDERETYQAAQRPQRGPG